MSVETVNSYFSSSSKREPVRTLIVEDVEKYRLIIGNILVYAKGKINFDINRDYKDSNGITHRLFSDYNNTDSYHWESSGAFSLPTSVFAYYDDGFYSYNAFLDKYKKYSEDWLLNRFIKKDYTIYDEYTDNVYDTDGGLHIKFLGWFLSPSKNDKKRITSIKDVYKKTDLFDFREDDKLPEITLYAHWDIPEYTVTLKNITRNSRYLGSGWSDFKYKGTTYYGNVNPNSFKIIYNTNMKIYLEKNVTDIHYRTFGIGALDGTSDQNSLRGNPQKHLGWSTSPVFVGSPWDLPVFKFWEWGPVIQSRSLNENENNRRVTLYPQFTPITILKRSKELPKGTYWRWWADSQHPTGIYKLQKRKVGGHYYLIYNYGRASNPNSHLSDLWYYDDGEFLDFLQDDEGKFFHNVNDESQYFYDYKVIKRIGGKMKEIIMTDTYSWVLVEKDNTTHFDYESFSQMIPLSTTFIYEVRKTSTTGG